MAYTKLFSSIVTSTIWSEDDRTRIVWITMLALADKNGEVQASIPGLAKVAGVSIDACESAIQRFLSPDPYSRTKDDEGRRIEEIQGGWMLLNYGKYRLMASKDEARASNAERQRRHRDRQKRNGKGVTGNGSVTHHRDIAEAEAEAEKENSEKSNDFSSSLSLPTRTPSRKRSAELSPEQESEFSQFWQAYPKRTGRGLAEQAWAKMRPPLPEVLAALEWQRNQPDWLKELGQFIPMPSTYLNQKRWLDQPAEVVVAAHDPANPF